PPPAIAAPDALFMLTGVLVVVDNLRSRVILVASVPTPREADDRALRKLHDNAERDLDDAVARLRAPSALSALELDEGAAPAVGKSSYDRADFMRDVKRIKDFIV